MTSASGGLQTLSCNTSFLCSFHCSHLFFQNQYLNLKTYKFLFMVLHTWTNISISNWLFNTLLSSKLKGDNFKHILFQHPCACYGVPGAHTWQALAHGWGARYQMTCEKKSHFMTFFPLKARDFSPSQVETFPINTALIIRNFSLRTGAVQLEGDSRSFMGSFIFSLSL